jgi:uncharacterized Zn finger protein
MRDTENCPLCSNRAKTTLKDFDKDYLVQCRNCGTFTISVKTFSKLAEGQYASRKASLLEFVKNTPGDKIAFIGEKFSDDVPPTYGLYAEYRPLKN